MAILIPVTVSSKNDVAHTTNVVTHLNTSKIHDVISDGATGSIIEYDNYEPSGTIDRLRYGATDTPAEIATLANAALV